MVLRATDAPPPAVETDLALAAACLRGEPAALARLDGLLDSCVPALAQRGLSRVETDEVLQRVRVRLLLGGTRSAPGLSRYSGRGSLGGFVRSSAVRAALNLRRDERAWEPLAADAQLADSLGDPDLAYMRRVYLDHFLGAFEDAWTALDDRQRLLLCYQLRDGLGIDEIGRLLGVHRATAARHLVGAREALVRGTRRALRRRTGAAELRLTSVLRLIRSQIGAGLEAIGVAGPPLHR